MADWQLRGDVLASARQAANLSRRALASAIQVADEDRIGLWERGEARPQARLVPLIAEQLGVEPLALLTGDSATPDLTRLRVAAGMSLQVMASRVGLPLSSYHRLERRGAPQGGLDTDIARALAKTLGISVKRLTVLLDEDRR